MGLCKAERAARRGAWLDRSVSGVVLLAALVVLAGCSDGDDTLGLLGGGRGALDRQALDEPSAQPVNQTPASLRAAYIARVQENAGLDYDFEVVGGRAVGRTPSQRFTAELADGALHVKPESSSADWSLELRWTGIGRGDDMKPVEAPVGGFEVEGNRASYRRSDGSEEWYLNGPLGVEQGFVLAKRPGGSGELVVAVEGRGLEAAKRGDEVVLRARGGAAVLRYTDLFASDAAGRMLPAAIRVQEARILLVVDDAAARYPVKVDPLVWTELKKLTAGDAEDYDEFGISVSIAGDLALVGAHMEDGAGAHPGAAYLFSKDQGGTDSWGQLKKLTASDSEDEDYFGRSVSVAGGLALVGAYKEDGAGTERGAAYLFSRDQGGTDNWGEVNKLTASDAEDYDRFGISVSLSIAGDLALVGAYAESGAGSGRGAAYLFSRDQGGTDNWGELKKLTASDAEDQDWFGWSVSIAGDLALVGAYKEDGAGTDTDRGAAYLFFRDQGGADNWGELRKLTAGDAEDQDCFGASVSNAGDFAVVGAGYEDGAGTDRGAAYLFFRDQGGADNWGEVSKLIASDAVDGDGFGYAVSIASDIALVGTFGAAYLFFRDQGGTDNWGEVNKLTASDAEANDFFGISVSIASDIALVGAYREDGAGTDRGAVYVQGLRLDDGDACTSGAECASTYCVDGVCCDSACAGGSGDCQACSVAAGAAVDGVCGPSTGNSCDDGLYCNGTDTCASGTCNHNGDPCPGADGDGNCAESCNEATDSCTAVDPDNSSCDDGQFCNGTETCSAGVCGGASSGDPCAANVDDADSDCSESCNEATDDCTTNDPDGSYCSDGSFCTGTETCTAGTCGNSTGDPCVGPDGDGDCAESCNEAADDCTANDPDSASCDDGAFCNGTETCTGGACTNSTGDPCPGPDGDDDCSESCDETADNCLANDNNGAACDDGAHCTETDVCQSGICVGSGDPCPGPDGDDDCSETCDEAADDCTGLDPEGSACDDGLYCTQTDTCQAGGCTGTGNPCSTNVGDGDSDCSENCNEQDDDCTANDPDGTPCEGDTKECVGGVCIEGGLDNGDPCTTADECQADYCTDGVCCVDPDCSPYRCASGGICAVTCSSTAACQPGFACSSDGKCEDAAALDSGADDGGCNCRLESNRTAPPQRAALGLLAVGLVLVRRRRRSGQRNAA